MTGRADQYAALPWRRTGGGPEYLLVTSRRTGRWIFPKGSAEPGEPGATAALREAAEEAGVEGRPAERPIGNYLALKASGGTVRPMSVELWPVEITGLAEHYPEAHLRKRRLVSAERAERLLTQADMVALLRRFHASFGR